ncbi:hypothetical protein L6164_012340 [Bauhinia variegata]|uniref:Uncharacterized protein n=3 Tax=Bauhinia variegata TaxID=167791 RepID=A0ACB9P9T2_BAUVA|nr:hypothetical protein L6164_012338 [Bauhinia variegata]KAI4345193.1 hypothetical protein L6164_012339 [Bauhinia variegata]KAI4345194.1 hypothetical protein L6164_012340 [Bauhinia variegata]
MKEVNRIFDDFLEKIIDEHKQSENRQRNIKDFVDVLLGFDGTEESEYRIERANIKAILLDMLAGSMDTTATAVEWTLSELIRHPRVMKKVQKELEEVVDNMLPSELDMVEEFGITVPRAKHLVAIPTSYRLHK